jgi:nucleoside-diphosphate-sugar epimerase
MNCIFSPAAEANEWCKAPSALRRIINNESAVVELLKDHRFDCVVNFVAFAPKDIERDLRLFRGKCSQYVFISSASTYQKPLAHPVVTESTPLKNNVWDYSNQKILCEIRLQQAWREEDFPMTIIRPSLTYETVIPAAIGSWEDFTLIERIRAGREIVVHGDGTSLWTITHSEDFAKGLLGLLGHQQAIGEAFHITSDELLTWNQIYEAMAEAAGTPARMVHVPSEFIAHVVPEWRGTLLGDKAGSVIFDNNKIKRYVPDYIATIPFKVGIKRTVQWFDSNARRKKIDDHNNAMLDAILAAYGRAFRDVLC